MEKLNKAPRTSVSDFNLEAADDAKLAEMKEFLAEVFDNNRDYTYGENSRYAATAATGYTAVLTEQRMRAELKARQQQQKPKRS